MLCSNFLFVKKNIIVNKSAKLPLQTPVKASGTVPASVKKIPPLEGYNANVCLSKSPVSDGEWHWIYLERVGHSLTLTMDDGESFNSNKSLPIQPTSLFLMDTDTEKLKNISKHLEGVAEATDAELMFVGGEPFKEGSPTEEVTDKLNNSELLCVMFKYYKSLQIFAFLFLVFYASTK